MTTRTASTAAATARIAFAADIAWRRSTRSTRAPLASANSSQGRKAKETRPEMSTGLRVYVAASSGSAVRPMPSARFDVALLA